MDKEPMRGERFQEICRLLFPGRTRSELAGELGGVSLGTLRNWEAGQSISRSALSRLKKLGASLEYLVNGSGYPLARLESKNSGKSNGNAKAAAALSPVEALAANMRFLRKERFPGWGGQRRFAEFLGLSPNDLCVYEYGRALPNEQRLEEMAKKLGFSSESLLRLLPGADRSSLSPRTLVEPIEDVLREEEEENAQREIARLEAINEVLREQIDAHGTRIRELEEANLMLRSLLYSENTPEGAERRRKLMERLESSVIGLGWEREVF